MLAFYLTVFGGFLCIVPLAIYCTVLAGINRRRHPTLISGVGEFGLALLGLSGFLIVGGPAVLMGLRSAWLNLWFHGSFASMSDLLDAANWPWALLSFLYFAAVVVGAIVMYRRRQSISILVNIDEAGARAVVAAACDRLNMPAERKGLTWFLGGPARSAVLELRPAPILRSVTLAWNKDSWDARPMVELEIRRLLPEIVSPVNPVASWLISAAVVLFVAQIVAFAMLMLFLYYSRF